MARFDRARVSVNPLVARGEEGVPLHLQIVTDLHLGRSQGQDRQEQKPDSQPRQCARVFHPQKPLIASASGTFLEGTSVATLGQLAEIINS
jgi:hypothetical protein